MKTANRVHNLLSRNPLHYWNSLLLQEAARHFVPVEATTAGRVGHRIWAQENAVTYEIDLPGHELEDLEVTLEKDVLGVAVKSGGTHSVEGAQVHLKECHSLTGTLQLQLPFRADAEQVETTFARGVLKIVVRRPAADLPRQLEIKGG